MITAHVADFVFDVAFLMAGIGIAEDDLETVMRFEARETFGYSDVFADATSDAAGVIEDSRVGNPLIGRRRPADHMRRTRQSCRQRAVRSLHC